MMELHFIRPYWLLALIPLAIVLLRINFKPYTNNWQEICDAHLLPYLVTNQQKSYFPWLTLLLAIAWFLSIIALAGPSFSQQKQSVYRVGAARIILMSLSPSMYELNDSTTKLNRARYKIFDLLKSKAASVNGLVVFTEYPFLVSPLTEDVNTISNLVPLLEPNLMPVAGNNIAAAIKEAETLFEQAGVSSGNAILITDKIENLSEASKAAAELKAKGFKLFVLDISPDDAHDAKKLAYYGGGESVSVTFDNSDIEELNQKMQQDFLHQNKATSMSAVFWKDNGRWIAALILPLALVAFRRGYL